MGLGHVENVGRARFIQRVGAQNDDPLAAELAAQPALIFLKAVPILAPQPEGVADRPNTIAAAPKGCVQRIVQEPEHARHIEDVVGQIPFLSFEDLDGAVR